METYIHLFCTCEKVTTLWQEIRQCAQQNTGHDEDTPYELIKVLKPDILVKGGDWKKEDIVGSDIAKETHSLPYIEGISTSEIIEKIKGL